MDIRPISISIAQIRSVASEKGITMRNYRNNYGKGLIAILLILLMWAASSAAGELTLAWDPNDGDGTSLIGYNLYYKAGSSAAADPGNANLIYIPLSDPGFDPDHPSYQVTGLTDSEQYYFVVTAMYNDDESGMSNEVSATVGTGGEQNSSINASTDGTSAGSSGGGCFIDSLR
jgi:hypothetical protein